MRYLNKIIFIHSATIPYAEVQLDGNIHFIGTQGVGKSTVLRAILYFYNADYRKLGIPKGPTVKNFADWYLGYSNSFVIYEVVKETGAFCVVAFKSQNRVCYRFIDTPYKAEYFVKETGEAYNNWDVIRQKLDADRINISSIVNSYDQYRDIIYGNFTGKKEFKKYALLETKQYKNIYRTIQNVFLNTKLDAFDIKKTIISSMEEEQIAIDLDQYSHHLDGFEKNLNDIKEFRRTSVQKQAENAIKVLSVLKHINKDQENLAGQLKYRLETIEIEEPEIEKQRTQQINALNAEKNKFKHEKDLFEKRKVKINDRISQLNGKLKDAARRKKYYDGINITELIMRVSSNEEKKLELDSLKHENAVLTNEFSDINNKYEALVKEQEYQLNAFVNQKESQKVEIEKSEVRYILELNREYEKLFVALENEHETESKDKKSELSRRVQETHQLEKQKVTINLTKFYEKEIEQANQELKDADLILKQESNNIITYQEQIKTLQTKWEFEVSDAEKNNERKKEKLREEISIASEKKKETEDKINRSKDSLYGWLNQNKPGWENTIGKVIDEDLLFQDGLSPKIIDNSSSLFGLEINLDDIALKIKTIDDYNFELSKLIEGIKQFQEGILELTKAIEKEKESIQRRNLPKIKELKEKIRNAEYLCGTSKKQIDKSTLEIDSYSQKSSEEKSLAIESIENAIEKAKLLEEEASQSLEVSESKLRRSKESKQKEKTARTNELKAENQNKIQVIQQQIEDKQHQIKGKVEILKNERNDRLKNKGADTRRLSEIERQITTIENELAYIDKKRDEVSDYHKDKRELFDKEKDFKNEIKLYEDKLTSNQTEYARLDEQISKNIEQIEQAIKALEASLSSFQSDKEKYKAFTSTYSFEAFNNILENSKAIQNSHTAIQLIDHISDNSYRSNKKQEELKISIDKFLSHFSENNIFKFPAKLLGTEAYINWTKDLSDFIEEDKISQFEKRTNERFSFIINSVGKEITMLISKTGDIQRVVKKINADFSGKRFLEAVTNIQLDIKDSKNTAVMLLKKIKEFNDENALSLGAANLFSGNNHDKNNEKAVELLKQLVKEINQAKNTVIELSDTFELTFRIEENGNDTGWVEKLTNVGSEGTDVLVKAMINIMLLNVFKNEGASRKFKDFKLHCMMDEIGKLHPNNVKGILNFANDRNILLINGSPTESAPLNYRHIYKISKDAKKNSKIKRIISNPVLAQ